MRISTDPIALLDCPLGAILIHAHAEGSPWRSDTALVGRILGRLHAMPLLAQPGRLSGSKALLIQGNALLDLCGSLRMGCVRIVRT